MKSFIDEYNLEGINYPSEKDDCKIFEKNNPTIVLNILYAKNENKNPAYFLKHNSKRQKQVIIFLLFFLLSYTFTRTFSKKEKHFV